MNFDRFGLNKEFCEERGYKVFFGTDWLDDSEYEALENFSRGGTLSFLLRVPKLIRFRSNPSKVPLSWKVILSMLIRS